MRIVTAKSVSRITHLERALSIARRSTNSSSPDLDAQCQSFYDSIKDERDNAQNAYQEGRTHSRTSTLPKLSLSAKNISASILATLGFRL